MSLHQNEVIAFQDKITGIDERYAGLSVYINPDLVSERNAFVPAGFVSYFNARLIQLRWYFHTFTTRYIGMDYLPIPVSDKRIFMLYAQRHCDDRYCYTELDTSWKYCFCEGKVVNTPLLMKYPKYTDVDYLPLVITPNFKVWSYYELDLNSLTVLIKDTTNNQEYLFNYANNKDKFRIIQHKTNNGFIYDITLYPDLVFMPNSKIEIYIDVLDIWGNRIKKMF